ncbi:hypothetical protein C823_002148 [Eubacterium plexicaudatum ASF492]|nr:hypothetical protein C823_002148 [Eubacterium plexicaudatum ASF492]
MEKWKVKDISNNLAVNGILLAYAKKARRQNIQVVMDIRLEENLPIRDIDWIAILANMFENAIHGCAGSGQPQQVIDIYISQKKTRWLSGVRIQAAKRWFLGKGCRSRIKAKAWVWPVLLRRFPVMKVQQIFAYGMECL